VYDLQVEPSEIYMCNGVIVKNCTCLLSYIYSGEADVSTKMDSKQGAEYLQSLPKGKAVELLGVQGYKDFKQNPRAWEAVVKNWEGHETKTAKIPLSLLHGNEA
jgi:hypothetical protein